MKQYHDDPTPDLVWVHFEFDFNTVERVTGFSRGEIIDRILTFDAFVEQNGLSGYIDLSNVISDAIAIPYTRINENGYVPHIEDYFRNISDMTCDLQDLMDSEDDIDMWIDRCGHVAERSHCVSNLIFLGLTLSLDDEHKEFLNQHIAYYDDFEQFSSFDPYKDPFIQFIGDMVSVPTFIEKSCNDNDEQYLHSIYRNAVDRHIPSKVRPTRNTSTRFIRSGALSYQENKSRRANRY